MRVRLDLRAGHPALAVIIARHITGWCVLALFAGFALRDGATTMSDVERSPSVTAQMEERDGAPSATMLERDAGADAVTQPDAADRGTPGTPARTVPAGSLPEPGVVVFTLTVQTPPARFDGATGSVGNAIHLARTPEPSAQGAGASQRTTRVYAILDCALAFGMRATLGHFQPVAIGTRGSLLRAAGCDVDAHGAVVR